MKANETLKKCEQCLEWVEQKKTGLIILQALETKTVLHWMLSTSITLSFSWFLGKFEPQRSYDLLFIKKYISMCAVMYIVAVIK